MALTWVLRDERVCSALIGVSRLEQLKENLAAATAPPLDEQELQEIEQILDRFETGTPPPLPAPVQPRLVEMEAYVHGAGQSGGRAASKPLLRWGFSIRFIPPP